MEGCENDENQKFNGKFSRSFYGITIQTIFVKKIYPLRVRNNKFDMEYCTLAHGSTIYKLSV